MIGLDEALAVQNLEDAGFAVDVLREANADVPEGEVIFQNPEAGTRLDKGDTVTIVASSGVETVSVPRLQGLSFDEANARLEELGLVVVRRNVFSDTRPQGEVASQDPKPGEILPVGTEIIVRVSKGRQTVEVPDVVGLLPEEAEQTLSDAGFEVNVVTGPSLAAIGTVFAQTPEAGEDAAAGSTVQISVSDGPAILSVPDVVGGRLANRPGNAPVSWPERHRSTDRDVRSRPGWHRPGSGSERRHRGRGRHDCHDRRRCFRRATSGRNRRRRSRLPKNLPPSRLRPRSHHLPKSRRHRRSRRLGSHRRLKERVNRQRAGVRSASGRCDHGRPVE